MLRLLSLGLILSGCPLSADTVVLSFDSFPDSTILTTQYPGVTFTNAMILTSGISLNEFEFPPHSMPSVVSDNNGPMSIEFANAIQSFGGYFTYTEGLTIDAFGAGNVLMASTTSAFSNNEALSGVVGSSPNEFLQVIAANISYITITGDPTGGSFALDDATYTTGGSTGAPEPGGSHLFLIGGMFALACCCRSRLRSFLVFIVAPFSVLANPSITATTAAPAFIPVNMGVTVTFTATITDQTVIGQSVSLIQYDGSGTAVIQTVGQLHDDGQNGDVTAGDGVYTIQAALPDTAVGSLTFKVSAAFTGVLRRTLSEAVTVQVTANTTITEPNTQVTITVPNVGAASQAVYRTPDGVSTNSPYIDVQFYDSTQSAYQSAFEIVIDPNSSGLSLSDWFAQNIDQDGLLLSGGSFVLTSLSDGTKAFLLENSLPPMYDDFPVEDAYFMLPNDQRIFTVSASENNALYDLGYSSENVMQFAQQLMGVLLNT